VEKVFDIKYYVKIILLFYNSVFPSVTFPSTFQFLIIFGTGFEELTVVRICNVVWVRTPYSLVHTWLWLFCSIILSLPTRAIILWKQ